MTIKPQPKDGYAVDEVTVTGKDGDKVTVTANGDGAYSFTQPSGQVTIAVTFRAAACAGGRDCPCYQFTDVNTAMWHHQALDYVVANGLMNGASSTAFAPMAELNRGMLVTILWRMENQPVVNYLMTFADVDESSYYAEAIRWASGNGMVKGYGNGLFGPNDNITREQLAVILYNYAQYKGVDVSSGEDTNILSYADAGQISEWAIPALQWACGAGLLKGNGNGYINPTGTATRAETAQMLMNYHNAAQ